MSKHRIILDCDPGVDDAVALLLAFASPNEIDLIGITTVAGNVPLADTTRNALRICALADRSEIPVYLGCSRPILPAEQKLAGVHGKDGLGDIDLPDAGFEAKAQHAVDFIIEAVTRSPGEITLCPIGPFTNIALALIKEPAIAGKIKNIVLMGGAAFCPGNSTSQAEFNVWCDPRAAQIVFSSGIPLVMFGLDVTNQAILTPQRLQTLESGGETAATAVAMLRQYGSGDPALHDPCVIAYLLDPSIFAGVEARVTVDCASPLSMGRTVAAVSERHREGAATNCLVITKVDDDRLFSLLDERLRALSWQKSGLQPVQASDADSKYRKAS